MSFSLEHFKCSNW